MYYYKYARTPKLKQTSLALSEDGRLLGYNVCDTAQGNEEPLPTTLPSETSLKLLGDEALMPLLEEQFMAGSVAKMAEGAAKQIYRLRETRLNLLAGDMEHVPADGVAMQLVLDELNKQEQALVELFLILLLI